MLCTVGNHEKHPGLFPPSERRKPDGKRRCCSECWKKAYGTPSGRRSGMAWRGAGRLALKGTK